MSPRALARRPFLLLTLSLACIWSSSCSLDGSHARGSKLSFDDYVEIQELYSKYAHTIDSGEDHGRAWASTFTEDGLFVANGQTNGRGRAELAAFIERVHQDPTYLNRHLLLNLRLAPTNEGVDGSVYVVVIKGGSGAAPPSMNLSGVYADKLVKTAEGWRFKERRVTFDVRKDVP